jgi:O-antigen/teichoic acid export membrane protein
MTGLAAKVGLVSVARGINATAILIASAALARLLSPADYGTYQQSWLIVTVAATILLSGIPVAILYFAARDDAAARRGFLAFVLAILAVFGAAGATLLTLFADRIASSFHNPALAAHLPILGLYVLAILPANPLESFLIVENRHARLAWITLAASIAMIVAIVLPPAAGVAPLWIYRGLALYALCRSSLLLVAVLRIYRGVTPRLPRTLPREFLLYTLPLAANEVVRVLSGWIDKALVSTRFAPETFAIYANGAFEIPFIGILLASITSVLMPELARLARSGDRETLRQLWRRAMLRTAVVLLPLCAFALLFARDLMIVVFSERYAASAVPFRVYLLLLPLRCAAYTPLLLAIGRSKAVLAGAIADFAVTLGLSLLLIPRLGYVGPAVAMVVSTYAQVAFYMAVAGRALALSPASLVPWSGLARIGVAAAFAALPAAVLLALAPSLPAVARLAAGALLFSAGFLAAAQLGIVPREERAFLLRPGRWIGLEPLARREETTRS